MINSRRSIPISKTSKGEKMIKRIAVTLMIVLLSVGFVYAQENLGMLSKGYELNPYEVGVKKEIGDQSLLVIEYINTPVSKDTMSISGTVKIPPNYKVLSLTVDYYITDYEQQQTYVIILDLEKGTVPNTFTFEKHYPFDLTKYEYELMVIEFMNELIDTHSI